METLKEKLKDFESKINENTNEDKLQELFKELAPAFLYGGYIQVRNDYRVYIKTVEFYFHSEKDNGVHDPIVYHRNNKYVEGEIPYFPLMSLHAHSSGFDITFESKEKQYRASALIRAYEIWDIVKNHYVVYDKTKLKFRQHQENEQIWNDQSTYLYDFLNGFGSEGIFWVNDESTQSNELKPSHRKGVYESTNPNNYELKEIDGKKILDKKRQWSFTRQEDIILCPLTINQQNIK